MPCSVAGAAVVGVLAIVAAAVVYRKVSGGSGGRRYQRCGNSTACISLGLSALSLGQRQVLSTPAPPPQLRQLRCRVELAAMPAAAQSSQEAEAEAGWEEDFGWDDGGSGNGAAGLAAADARRGRAQGSGDSWNDW